MIEKYYENYLGIVITPASEDPEGRNRIQVWVPGISNTLYKDWNNTETDKSFYNLDTTQNNGLKQDQIKRLREMLPWAECAAPLMGGSASFAHSQPLGGSSYSSSSTAAPVETSTSREDLIEQAPSSGEGYLPGENADTPLPPLPVVLPETPSSGGTTTETGDTIFPDRIEPPLPTE